MAENKGLKLCKR